MLKYSMLAKIIQQRCFKEKATLSQTWFERTKVWAMILARWATSSETESDLLFKGYGKRYPWKSRRFFEIKKRCEKGDPKLFQTLLEGRKKMKESRLATNPYFDRLQDASR